MGAVQYRMIWGCKILYNVGAVQYRIIWDYTIPYNKGAVQYRMRAVQYCIVKRNLVTLRYRLVGQFHTKNVTLKRYSLHWGMI